MNASLTTAARVAGITLVVWLAAILGLIAGNVLDSRDDSSIDAGALVDSNAYADGPPAFADPHRQLIEQAEDAAQQPDGPPAYADPYRQLIEQAGVQSESRPFTQTWGNLDERRPAAQAETPALASASDYHQRHEFIGNDVIVDGSGGEFSDWFQRHPMDDGQTTNESLTTPTPR